MELVHGAVRHPQSQGLVEKQNSLLSKSFEKSFSNYIHKQKNGKAWDIYEAISFFLATENNKVHTVTKELPNKLVNELSEEKIKEVQERIQNYYKKINEKFKESGNIQIGAKVAIIQDVALSRGKKTLIQKNSHKFSIRMSNKIGETLLNGEFNISLNLLMKISGKM